MKEKEIKEKIEDWEKEFVEKGADLEHQRWARWEIWQENHTTPENLKRWRKQAKTPYSELSEVEKESDRKETRNYLPLIRQLLTQRDKMWQERIKAIELLNKLSKKIETL